MEHYYVEDVQASEAIIFLNSRAVWHSFALLAVVVSLILCATVFAFHEAEANADAMYVSNLGSDTIRWERLDGLNRWEPLPDASFMSNNPFGVALDIAEGWLYMVNTGGKVLRSTPGGWVSQWEDLGNLGGLLSGPFGLALDLTRGQMYVTNFSNGKVIRARLDGTYPEDLGNLNSTLFGPDGIALDIPDRQMYIANYGSNAITRANMDGSGAVSLGNLNNTLSGPRGIALTFNQMYVVNSGNNTISRANMDGSGGVSLGNLNNTLNNPEGIALDLAAGKMYVANSGNNTISHASLDGTGGIVFASAVGGGFENPKGIALEFPLYTITRQPHAGGNILCTPLQVAEAGTSECSIYPNDGYHIVDVVVYLTANPVTQADLGAAHRAVLWPIASDWTIEASYGQNHIWLYDNGMYQSPTLTTTVTAGITTAAAANYDEIRVESGLYFEESGQYYGLTCSSSMTVIPVLSGGWSSQSVQSNTPTSFIGPLTIGGGCSLAIDRITII